MSGSRFAVGAGTDVGRGRPANEDAFLVDDGMRLYAVADGMGGHRAGEVASAIAIETLVESYGAGQALQSAVSDANSAVYAKAETNDEMRGMGTTLTVLSLTDDERAVFGHVGDSRAYLARAGDFTQVTEDHSLVEQLVREGRLSPEEAINHPQRAIITRALGVDPQVQVDIYEIGLQPGDRVLLCSDGLTNMLADESIADVLRHQADPQAAVTTLIEMANAAGGDDNITAVLVDVLAEGTADTAVPARASVDEPTAAWSPVDADDEPEAPAAGPGDREMALVGAAPEPTPVASAAALTPAPELAPQPPPPSGPPVALPKPARPPGPRRSTRLALWLLPIVVIVGGGFGAVGWYARRTFYVGLNGEKVTLFRGVPGGLLGWDPTIENTSPLEVGDLTASERVDLEEGHRFSSRAKAVRFLERLEARTDDTEAGSDEADDPVIGASTTTSTGR